MKREERKGGNNAEKGYEEGGIVDEMRERKEGWMEIRINEGKKGKKKKEKQK